MTSPLEKYFNENPKATLETLRGSTGLSRSFLSQIKNGQTCASGLRLLKLARAINCSTDDLLKFYEWSQKQKPALQEQGSAA